MPGLAELRQTGRYKIKGCSHELIAPGLHFCGGGSTVYVEPADLDQDRGLA
jgi:hypothetical protein